MELSGHHLIGASRTRAGEATFAAVDPRSGETLAPAFADATSAEIDRAARLAAEAAPAMRRAAPTVLVRLLEGIADGLLAAGDALLARAERETALPRARLEGERARTVGQLRSFASLVASGRHLDVAREAADPARQPAPRPELAVVAIPVGPVAVFGASNFPLAFSVAGGDTASALAAGCPVVVKAHPAHPGTSEIAGLVVQAAVEAAGLHEGAFSLLFGASPETSRELVTHPAIRAVGFTGSLRAGRAIVAAAAARPGPIPVFAEMGSVNPVFLLDGALAERGADIARGLQQSLTLGVGQFCTNPGLLVLSRSAAADAFLAELGMLVGASGPGVMLHRGIRDAYEAGVARLAATPGVAVRARVEAGPGSGGCEAGAALLEADGPSTVGHAELLDEVFGPCTLALRCDSAADMEALARRLPGQLTATIHASPGDSDAARSLAELLADRAGRLVWNGFPTGVEVAEAMHHGGPWPAASQPSSTSVGSRAIRRFLRPVCYQGFPEEMLPPPLRSPAP